MTLSSTPLPNLFANASASPSLNATTPIAAAAVADSSSVGIILGAVSLGLVGLMGAVMGTNWLRRSGALSFLGALGVTAPPGITTGPRTKEQIAADAVAKTTILGRLGTMITSIKGQSAKITKLVDALPVPDSVKSFVRNPKSVLPQSAQDLITTAGNAVNQPDDSVDLENAEKAKPVPKKASRVTIAPSPTYSDDIIVDGGIELTNARARTSALKNTTAAPATPVAPAINSNSDNDVFDIRDSAQDNILLLDPPNNFVSRTVDAEAPRPISSNFVRNSERPIIKPVLPEGCKCEACLAAKAAHAPPPPPPPPPSTADVMKQLEDLKKFMVEQMKPVPAPPPVEPPPVEPPPVDPPPPVEPPTEPVVGPPKAVIEVNVHELEEILALLAERHKEHQIRN